MIESFLSQFTDWAKTHPEIKAIALVGSHARGDARPDSDIDLVVLADNPMDYIADPSWARNFGFIEWHRIEDWGKVTSLRVWYEDGPEVEFGFTAIDWAAQPLDDGARQVIDDGILILYDPQALLNFE
jgi:hypothetical protein